MSLDAFSLEDTTAVVTGGSRGIGREIAVALATAGATVVPVARSEAQLLETVDAIEEVGGEGQHAVADVTEPADIVSVFDAAEQRYGSVDILVNNAGINPYFGSTESVDSDTVKRILAVNLQGSITCACEFGKRRLGADETGAIVNIASVGGVRGLPYQMPYTVSKHGIVGLTKSLAIEWAPDIRVNAVAPGYVETELTAGVRDNEEIYGDLLSEIPQERFADPAEIAGSVVYLTSDAASYVTGEVHLVDGGMTA